MAHYPYEVMINLALDGELSKEEEDQLSQHLETCSACTDLMRRMQRLDSMLGTPITMAPPADFTAAVMARVGSYERSRRAYPWVIGLLVLVSLSAAGSIAAPTLFFSAGLHEQALTWPLIGAVLQGALQTFTLLQFGATLAVDLLASWLTFLIEEPVALATVVSALVIASIWIGLLEGVKAMRRAALQPSGQRA